ncbi:MAG TPA: hypothetical protein VK722_07160 [Candidatus Aquilonibacter sp.]|jgi:hypothetical protein|nr:hypothetical protein [Candidatus Aquilonibacter sp.]
MKQSEAIRIPALLAARRPAPIVEEAVIDGVRMLVIMGSEVDTVIQYIRGGGVKMPQLSSYDEIAEDAARADVLLAKQPASGAGTQLAKVSTGRLIGNLRRQRP